MGSTTEKSARDNPRAVGVLAGLALFAIHISAVAETASTEAAAVPSRDAEPAADEPGGCSGPFCQGSIGLTLMVGSRPWKRDYLLVGAGVGYYLIDGLSVGLDADVWFLEDPTVFSLQPHVRYVLWFVPFVKPYVGVLYRHYFLQGDFDDPDSVGGRGGVYVEPFKNATLGLGAAGETLISCEENKFRRCNRWYWYPELSFGYSF